MPSRTARTTTQKRLGNDHQINRQRLLARHTDGTPCWWCGRPMYRDRTKNWDYKPNAQRKDGKPDTSSGSLAADHTKPRSTNRNSIADRIIHGTCNKERGDGTRDHLRPALTHNTDPNNTDTQLGTRVFDWP